MVAYSDSHVDLPLLRWAHKGVAVNPSRRLRRCARSEGLEIVDACLVEDPENVGALTLRGRFLTVLGNLTAAEGAIIEALELDPDHAEGYFALGLIRAEHGEWENAAVALQRAIEIEPGQLSYLSALIWAYQECDQLDAAAAVLEQAMQIEPFDPVVLTSRASIAAKRGPVAEARECAELAHKQSPRNAQALRILASIHLDGADYDAAAAS